MAQTLANLVAEAEQRANQESKTLVSPAEWRRYTNLAISELYDRIVAVNPHYYVSSADFTLSSANSVALSTLTNFWKLRGVDFRIGSRSLDVRPFDFMSERNRFSSQNFAGTYTAWWTPTPPSLSADGDTLDAILDVWAEYITVTAAIQAVAKEESDLTGLAALKQALIERISVSAGTRSAEPGQAADLSTGGPADSGRRYALRGASLVILGSDPPDLWF